MHIEKNVCENIIGTILNVNGISKDNLQSRLDLVDMGIRRDLHPQVLPNGKYRLPPSIFAMSKEEKEMFCMVLKDIKVSDAYASNISRCVSLKDRRLYSLKSHDYHILMQDLLPVALRCYMSKKVTSCIIELSNIMKAICGKVLNVKELEKVQDQTALALCNLENIFPYSFFIIIMHLLIHLPHEAILGGLVFYRWMYHIKRYLEDVETRLNRPSKNTGLTNHNLAETYLFQSYGEPIGKVEIAELDDRSWIQAHRYVLFHHDSIGPLCKFGVGRTSMKKLIAFPRSIWFYNDEFLSLDSHWTTIDRRALKVVGRAEVEDERFALEVSDTYIKKALGKKWRDHKSTLKKEYFKKDISLEEKLRIARLGMLSERVGTSNRQKQKFTHTVGSKSVACVAEAEVRFQQSGVNPTQNFGSNSQQYMPSRSQAQAEVQRLRDQMAQMQVSTVEQIAQLKAEAASREAEVQRKYEELELQLKEEAAAMEAKQNRKYNELQHSFRI
ncbi:hypothetical protein PVK06_024964 [Gossypium arboreum]|uniref:DUF4218 domain-containing protein n=1 Tax=Gossypium arboreum TaxID=29729 RepID=A0ABR0PF84_GOSAR|nr:hypothetical protein PVK06_024964 [Gossypium arboreum]